MVVSCCLEDPPRVMFECSEAGLSHEDFTESSYREIFKAIEHIYTKGDHVDAVTIYNRIKATTPSEQPLPIEPIDFDHLSDSSHLAYKSKSFIDIVKGKSILRKIESAAKSAIHLVEENKDDPQRALADAQSLFIDIQYSKNKKSKDQIYKEILNGWERAANGEVSGYPSPWKEFDKKLGGPQNGLVTLVAGERGNGKSTIIHNWVLYLGKHGYKTAVMPFEDGANNFVKRMAGNHGDFSVFQRDVGYTADFQMETAKKAVEEVLCLPIFIEDAPMTMNQIQAWAIQMKAKEDIDILFIDGFKDITRTGKISESVEEDNRISGQLCALAKRLKIPIVVVHHIKKTEKEFNGNIKKSTVLTMNDIRGSGRITDDARQVIILQVEKLSAPPHNYFFDIAKNNNGPTGVIQVQRHGDRQRFVEQ